MTPDRTANEMPRDALDRWIDAITTHNRIVIVVLLLMTAGMVMGIGEPRYVQSGEQRRRRNDARAKAEYIADNYDDPGDGSNVSPPRRSISDTRATPSRRTR